MRLLALGFFLEMVGLEIERSAAATSGTGREGGSGPSIPPEGAKRLSLRARQSGGEAGLEVLLLTGGRCPGF